MNLWLPYNELRVFSAFSYPNVQLTSVKLCTLIKDDKGTMLFSVHPVVLICQSKVLTLPHGLYQMVETAIHIHMELLVSCCLGPFPINLYTQQLKQISGLVFLWTPWLCLSLLLLLWQHLQQYHLCHDFGLVIRRFS